MTDERLDEIKTKWNIPVTLPMAVPWGKDDVVWLVQEVERLRAEAIQLAAAQERIKLLEEGAILLRDISDDVRAVPAGFDSHYLVEKATIDINVGSYLARLDAAPGELAGEGTT